MVQSTAEVLEERGKRYGKFANQASIAQSIHVVLEQGLERAGKSKFDFHPDELEAVNMIVNKIARIYNGDSHYSDSWRDISGYATLVAERLEGEDNLREARNNVQKALPEMASSSHTPYPSHPSHTIIDVHDSTTRPDTPTI